MAVHARFRLETIPEIEAAVMGLGAQSAVQMATHKLPSLYSGAIRYRQEKPGKEEWQSAAITAAKGYGDCEDLAAYRVAELRRAGIDAYPKVLRITPTLRHVVVAVRDRDGREHIEDPSKLLGM